MTEDQNKEFDLLQLADEMSHKNWLYFKFLYNEKFREAEQRIEKLQQYIGVYQDQTNILLTRVEELETALRKITETAPFGQPQEIARAALGEG